jgi:hypothetical protein
MRDLLPSASINIRNDPREFLNQLADLADASNKLSAEKLFDFEPGLRMDIVNLIPKFQVIHEELFGQFIYIPEYKQTVSIEVRARRWMPKDPPTYETYSQAIHLMFDMLISAYNKKFSSRYRISVASKESLEPKLPPKAKAAFKEFTTLANKRMLHPLDWKRFYVFAYICHATHTNPNEEDITRLLIEDGFENEYAANIASVFFHLSSERMRGTYRDQLVKVRQKRRNRMDLRVERANTRKRK